METNRIEDLGDLARTVKERRWGPQRVDWANIICSPIVLVFVAVLCLVTGIRIEEWTHHRAFRCNTPGLDLFMYFGGFLCYAVALASAVAAIGYPIWYAIRHEVFRRRALWFIRDSHGEYRYEMTRWDERRTVNGGIALVFQIGGRRQTGAIETNATHQDRAINNAWRFELIEIRGDTAIVRMHRGAEALELPVTDALEFMDRFVCKTDAYGASLHHMMRTIIRRYRELHATDRLLRNALDAMDSTIRAIRDSKGRFGKSKDAAGMRVELMRAALEILRQAPFEDPRLTAYAEELRDVDARPLPPTVDAKASTDAP